MLPAMARFVLVHGAFGGAWTWGPVTAPREALGRKNRQRAVDEFSQERMFAAYANVFAGDPEAQSTGINR